MNARLSSVWPRLVIVEGIMGSGKSITTLNMAQRLNASGIAAVGVTEGTEPHPIRFDWDVPWSEMPPSQLAKSSVATWKTYADSAVLENRISIVDGQLFHGNLTSLFLLEGEPGMIAAYCRDIVLVTTPLRPLLIYFHQTDVDKAIRLIGKERGEDWVNYQINWKLESPYAKRRGLMGVEGLISLYREYRTLTDQLFDNLDIPKISVETSGRDWAAYDGMIDHALMSAPMLTQAATNA